MSANLTDAGRTMLLKYLEHEKTVLASKSLHQFYTAKDGRIFMALGHGDGAAAATVRKLVRDGFAEGSFNWRVGARWMIATDKGRAAVRASIDQDHSS